MKLLVIAALALVLQTGPQTAKASLEGVVLNAITNVPIAGVQVTLARPTVRPTPGVAAIVQPQPVTTDSQGKFAVSNLDADAYRLTFARNGYVRQQYGQASFSGGQGTPVTLTAGQAMKDVVMRLTPTATISGRIRDVDGRPIVAVPVLVLRAAYTATGQKTFQTAGSGRTNDQGEYRIYWINPGRYYLMAGGPASGPGTLIAVASFLDRTVNYNELVEGYTAVFYPNAAGFDLATSIQTRPGIETTAIDFTLKRPSLFRIRGRVVDSRTGQPPAQAQITVSAQTLTGSGGGVGSSNFYNASTGMVEIRDLAPGNYVVTVTLPGTGTGVRGGPGATNLGATVNVPITNADAENVVLTITPPIGIAGRVLMDGATPPTTALRLQLRPSLDGAIVTGRPSLTSTPPEQSAFRIEDVTSGEYRLSLATPGMYIKEARYGGTDVLNRPLRVSGSDTSTLDISLSSNVAQVDGILLDRRRQPRPSASVTLIPDRARDRMDLYKTATTDQNGRFSIPNIPPGDYKVFAWESLEPYAHFDPEVLKQSESKGIPVKLLESSKATVEVQLIPEEQ